MQVGFAGLGRMGAPIAGNLVRAGHRVTVWNRSPEKARAFADAIREVCIIEQTYYRWRRQYGGMGTDQLKELKRLQKENKSSAESCFGSNVEQAGLGRCCKGNTADRQALRSKTERFLSPSRRRACINHVRGQIKVSWRRICRILGQHRSTQRRRQRGRATKSASSRT